MIQRIQSIWLLLASLCGAGLFFFDLYRADTMANGLTVTEAIRANSDFLFFLLALIITVLPLIAIFLFKNRKMQRLMALLSMVLDMGFIAYMLMQVGNKTNSATSAPVNGTYWIGSVLPVLSIVFLILAIRGIRKDEKLIKSLDRLR